jgi:hypothetical protein
MVIRAAMRSSRRGFALMDVLVAGVVLGVSLALLIGLVGRSMTSQMRSERLATAAMLVDEILGLVLIEGPEDFRKFRPLEGQCEPPFEEYTYEITLSTPGAGSPYRVTASVYYPNRPSPGRVTVQTLIAPRLGDESPVDRMLDYPLER